MAGLLHRVREDRDRLLCGVPRAVYRGVVDGDRSRLGQDEIVAVVGGFAVLLQGEVDVDGPVAEDVS